MEKRGLLILLLAGFCGPAYNQIRNRVFVETVKSWSEAQSYCREMHSDLATVFGQEEAKQLLNIAGVSLYDKSWIGLYRDDTQNWQWSNSDDVIYSNWRADLFCASVNSEGKWIDSPCNLQKAFMCYKETSNITERYTLIEELKTWTEAEQYCREHHTDLVSIKSASENEDLVNKAQGRPFWIGLFNEPWKWSHQGDSYTFYNWSNGEPNSGGDNVKCVTMSKSGGWLGYDCNSLFPFFCCEGGSSGQCFYEETKKTWQEAQSYCRNQSRDLPSIHDQARVNELIGLISSTNDTAYWIGLYHDKENWQWSSGGDVIYSNWEPYLFCASVNAEGEWEDSVCDQRNYFMCYSEASDITERYTLIEELKTWTEAQQYCRENHIDLVSIKSASEHEDLVKKAQGTPFWIGLFNETWKWPHQGDNYTFYSWSKGEPNNDGGNQNCVMMSKTGEWTDTGCNDLNSFFCCEGGSSGQCFYEETKKTWQEAQSYCRNQSRDLPSIHDQARVNELIGLISSTNDTAYWIGLYHDKENWQWSSGGDVIYSNWEPHLFCASVNAEGEWEDSLCDQNNYFMCYSEASDITERYTLIEEQKTWTEAQQYCRAHHTDLISIKNASENEEIVKKAQGKPFWIGLFNEPWKWSHRGHNYTFHNWSNGEPNSGGDNVKCVTMSKSGGWNDYGCSYLLPFFCSNESTPPPSTLDSQKTWRPSSTPVSHDSNPTSPPSTLDSQKSSSPSSTPVSQSTPVPEELHLISHSMVWPEAWQYCKDHYTDLVSLTSLAAQNRVSELVRNSTASRFWIGLHRTVVYDNWYWVAGKDKRSPLNYTDWAPGEPNNPYFEHCGEMVLREDGGAEWNDLCCYEKLPFVCFKD